MHDFQEQGQVHRQQCQVRRQRSKNGFWIRFIDPARNWEITSKQCIIKQLLDSVFVISGIIKILVSVISLSLWLRLMTLTSTLLIPDITKTSSNNNYYCLKPKAWGIRCRRKYHKTSYNNWTQSLQFVKSVKFHLTVFIIIIIIIIISPNPIS